MAPSQGERELRMEWLKLSKQICRSCQKTYTGGETFNGECFWNSAEGFSIIFISLHISEYLNVL